MNYSLAFRPEVEEDDKVVIFGLFHCAREPRSIQDFLNKRNKTNS